MLYEPCLDCIGRQKKFYYWLQLEQNNFLGTLCSKRCHKTQHFTKDTEAFFCLNWLEPTSGMCSSCGSVQSSVLELFVDAVPFFKNNPIFMNPVVKELQHYLLMRGICWMRRVQYSRLSSDDLYNLFGPTETSWETGTEEQSFLSWESL